MQLLARVLNLLPSVLGFDIKMLNRRISFWKTKASFNIKITLLRMGFYNRIFNRNLSRKTKGSTCMQVIQHQINSEENVFVIKIFNQNLFLTLK
jgi:hypothetical protein